MNLINVTFLISLLVIIICFKEYSTQSDILPRVLTIGGIFDKQDYEQELAFQIAVQRVYSEFNSFSSANIQGLPLNASFLDTFEAKNAACNLLQKQVVAIVDATSSPSSFHVSSICDAFEIPHIQTQYSWHPSIASFSIKMYPEPGMIARAVIDLIRKLEWQKFAILYEDDEDIVFVNEIFRENQGEGYLPKGTVVGPLNWEIGLFAFESVDTYRDTFGQVRKDSFHNIILHVKSENLFEAMKQAQQVGLLTDEYSFIITSLDLHAISLDDFKYSKARIHSYRLIDSTDNKELTELTYKWNYYAKEFGMDFLSVNDNPIIRTKIALAYDAVRLVFHAIEEAEKAFIVEPNSLSCDETSTWSQGTSIMNFLTAETEITGITGDLVFDEFGYRTHINLKLYELAEYGFNQIGVWSDINDEGLKLEISPRYYTEDSDVKGTILKVVTVEEKGYTMIKTDHRVLEGNDRFEGYVIDLLKELSDSQKFKYEIYLYEGKDYGNCNNQTMTCTGMLGEITSNRSHMALVDLTITSERAQVVDFTHPFINTGISILFKRLFKSETDLFGFLDPFSPSVWLMIILTVLSVGVSLHIHGRLSPYEWINPYPCRENEDIHENDFTLANSGWFIVAALMQQGSEVAPRTLSTRWLAGVWYFFTLILVSCYTANLAASLSVEKFVYPFNSAKDLITMDIPEVQRIMFGCKSSGSTINFFKNSKDPLYQKIYERMIANPHWLAKTNLEGELRVRESNYDYAFFMESATIDYKLERNCSIVKIGGLLDHKGYGIAVRRNSPLLRILNQGLLDLQEKGKLRTLYDRWWKQRNGGGVCSTKPSSSAAVTSFKLINVGGVFIVLLLGCGIGALIAITELLIKNVRNACDSQSFVDGIKYDMRFAVKLQETSKPNRKMELARSASEDKSSKISNFSSKWESNMIDKNP